MKKSTWLGSLILCLILVLPGLSTAQEKAETIAPKPLENISDIMAWKTIGSSVISKNGEWFGYNLSPLEGDGKVILKQTRGDKEHSFDAGQAGLYSRGATILFSEDARWAAFSIQPTTKEAETLKKEKKRSTNKMALVDLSNGEK
ncbi:MAG: S9 family peptidase, partial [Candidatus Aminicenantes bacterium]|nr:S9 family peptidase [Candidatus Aminicenantes bacterium]